MKAVEKNRCGTLGREIKQGSEAGHEYYDRIDLRASRIMLYMVE